MQAFKGFTEDTVRFLGELTSNNEKGWFDANRARYEACWVEPAKLFVDALGAKLARIAPGLRFDAKIDGSLLRINRDIRFSKNKAPYKEHFDLWFWEGSKRAYDAPGVFFRLRPDALELGAGIYGFGSAAVVKKFRKAVVDERAGRRLLQAGVAAERAGMEIGGEARKRVPAKFDPEHPRSRWLKYLGLHADGVTKVPKELKSARFVDYCFEHVRAAVPLYRWLAQL